MIQHRQGLSFKIIVFLIRIHAFAVKLFRSLYEITLRVILCFVQPLLSCPLCKQSNDVQPIFGAVSLIFSALQIFPKPGYLLNRADKSSAIINDEMSRPEFFRKW